METSSSQEAKEMKTKERWPRLKLKQQNINRSYSYSES